MKKLGLIFFSVVVLAGCGESQEGLTEQNILLYGITFSSTPNRLESHLACDCKGGVYIPASYELVAYD